MFEHKNIRTREVYFSCLKGLNVHTHTQAQICECRTPMLVCITTLKPVIIEHIFDEVSVFGVTMCISVAVSCSVLDKPFVKCAWVLSARYGLREVKFISAKSMTVSVTA